MAFRETGRPPINISLSRFWCVSVDGRSDTKTNGLPLCDGDDHEKGQPIGATIWEAVVHQGGIQTSRQSIRTYQRSPTMVLMA